MGTQNNMRETFSTLALFVVLSLSVYGIQGELNGIGYKPHGSGLALQWRCYRMPGAAPCLKGDISDRRSWFFDVSSGSCRMNPISSCDVTDHLGNDFYTLDECISTCMPGGELANSRDDDESGQLERSSTTATSTKKPTPTDNSKSEGDAGDRRTTASTELSSAASEQQEDPMIIVQAVPGDVSSTVSNTSDVSHVETRVRVRQDDDDDTEVAENEDKSSTDMLASFFSHILTQRDGDADNINVNEVLPKDRDGRADDGAHNDGENGPGNATPLTSTQTLAADPTEEVKSSAHEYVSANDVGELLKALDGQERLYDRAESLQALDSDSALTLVEQIINSSSSTSDADNHNIITRIKADMNLFQQDTTRPETIANDMDKEALTDVTVNREVDKRTTHPGSSQREPTSTVPSTTFPHQNNEEVSSLESTSQSKQIPVGSSDHHHYNAWSSQAISTTVKSEPDIVPGNGLSGHEDLQTAEANAHNAAMRTITIMLPVRYNELPAPVRDQVVPPSTDGGPSHDPLRGQLLGTLPQRSPFVVNRWSARFDLPPSESSGADTAFEADQDSSTKKSSSSPLSPGFFFNLLNGGRHQPRPQALPGWNRHPANEIHQQQMTSQARPEVEWQPAQLLHRYVKLHRDGTGGDTLLKNNLMMTAIAYGLLGRGRSQRLGEKASSPSTTSTTTAATTNTNRKRKLSAEYRRRAAGRYRSSPYHGGRRALRRHGDFDSTFDSDDEDDEILEALFGYERSPMTFRRVRRPSPSPSVGARRAYGRKRLGEGERRRRWRERDGPGKPRRRKGGRAVLNGDREKQGSRSRRPINAETILDKPAKPDVGPETPDANSGSQVSLLHVVVSRQHDFAVPQPALGFVDHPGLMLEPRPLDVDAFHSMSHPPFAQPPSPFLPIRPFIPDRPVQQPRQESDDKNTKTTRDEAKTGSDVIVTSSNNNICTLPVDIGNCKSYQNKWYFNHKVGRCDMFFYGGCGGNENRFETLEHCLRTCAHLLQQRAAGGKGDREDQDHDLPPGAPDSWNVVDNENSEEDQTTSKPPNVIVVTSPVYVPMTRDDLDSSDLPADDDVTPVWVDGERTKSSSPVAAAGPDDTQASVTSHRNISPTLHTDAIASHEKHEGDTEDEALILGLPRPYVVIFIILGIVTLAVIILVSIISLHMCRKVRKSKKAEILEEVVKAHTYGDLNKVVYSEPPTIKLNEKL